MFVTVLANYDSWGRMLKIPLGKYISWVRRYNIFAITFLTIWWWK
jgi:hypothetical protein